MNDMLTPVKDLEAKMKVILLQEIKKRKMLRFGDTIINEFTLSNFSRRVDLCTISEDKILGFEIKSKNDSLVRLKGQIEQYVNHFDKVIVFSDKKHTSKILNMIPKSVGLWELNEKGVIVRQRGITKKIKEKKTLLKMMNSSELRKLASTKKIKVPLKNRDTLERSLVKLPASTIRLATIQSLKYRFEVTSMLFWKTTHHTITTYDLKTLSPYSGGSLAKHEKKHKDFKSVLDKLIEDSIV